MPLGCLVLSKLTWWIKCLSKCTRNSLVCFSCREKQASAEGLCVLLAARCWVPNNQCSNLFSFPPHPVSPYNYPFTSTRNLSSMAFDRVCLFAGFYLYGVHPPSPPIILDQILCSAGVKMIMGSSASGTRSRAGVSPRRDILSEWVIRCKRLMLAPT